MNIAVLLSGGVDSSVALRLLQEQGHTLTAFYLKIWLEDELSYLGTCPWQEDLAYAQAVCDQTGVPLEIVSLQKEYWDEVVAHTIAEVKQGRTPNPDVLCNQRIKFGAFYQKISSTFDAVASGHYARIEKDENSNLVYLHTAPDPIKDQTYFLSHLSQAQLARALFPLGNLNKQEVRDLAARFDLPTKDRKDSQGICFLGKLKFSDFIKHHVGEKQGDLIEAETGKKVGTHPGFWFYTIGQRQGLGLAGGPWYVVAKQHEDNTVFISRNYYTSDKMRDTFKVTECNWIAGAPELFVHTGVVKTDSEHKRSEQSRTEQAGSGQTIPDLLVKLRHGPVFNRATLTALDDGSYSVRLAERDQGIAQGQYAVFYDGTRCLGSGVIRL